MTDAGIAQIHKLSKDDIVIALMGITGSGFVQIATPLDTSGNLLTLIVRFRKSTLISLLSDDYVQIGHELTSCKVVGISGIRPRD